MDGRRFALYFAPEDGSALAEFGWWWLGRRPDSPALPPLPEVGLEPGHQSGLVADARRYGFHATLKAPFRLAGEADEADLMDTAADFARRRRPFVEPPFSLQDLHGFLALRPRQPSAAIDALAGDCVREFDRFRAPPTEAERTRRLASPLSDRQKERYERWGYPYVFDEFRFHMTLTRSLRNEERDEVRTLLDRLSAAVRKEPVEFLSLCLFVQESADAPFVLAERFPFL